LVSFKKYRVAKLSKGIGGTIPSKRTQPKEKIPEEQKPVKILHFSRKPNGALA
jgi:hypothetical protein